MTILPIRTLGDPVLREPARDVESFDRTLRRLRDDMLETMYEAPGVGLAGPQVGLSLRFFVYDAGEGDGPNALANPVLSDLVGEQTEEEGCLSIPGVYHETKRAMRATVSGRDVDGRPVTVTGEGLVARIFQHETDHLNGMLFLERLDEAGRRQVMAGFRDRELGVARSPERLPRGER